MAKPVNFGYPGGLMPKAFVAYTEAQYKTQVSLDEAKTLREVWLSTYPELREWLADRTMENLAYNLRVSPASIRYAFGPHLWRLRQAVEGWVEEEEARPYVEKLAGLSRNPDVSALLKGFDYSPASHEALAGAVLRGWACTPTGRVRAKVGHNDGANTPFQGLASDGGKEAMWRLMYGGYRLKAFIHDELLVDAPTAACEAVRRRVHEIMDKAAEDVMGQGVPCMSESHVGPCWVKG